MPGRIGKTYPRLVVVPTPSAPAEPRRGVSYGLIGGLIAFLSALGVAGWLIFG